MASVLFGVVGVQVVEARQQVEPAGETDVDKRNRS